MNLKDDFEITVGADGRICRSYQGQVVEIASMHQPPPPSSRMPSQIVDARLSPKRFLIELLIGAAIASAVAFVVAEVFL